MNLETLISPNAVITDQPVKSKKRALEVLAVTLAEEASKAAQQTAETSEITESDDLEKIDPFAIFQLLTDREKLGSTGMGHGVALPHARCALTDHAIGAMLKLDEGVDFDSPDSQPTDLVFALMVPEQHTEEHLQILAHLASLFSDEDFCQAMRDTADAEEIYNNLISWQVTSQAS